ncbi:MAG: hypothetical protein WAV40_03140 [Microgenomates group bacterium]
MCNRMILGELATIFFMDIDKIRIVLAEEPWSVGKVDDAARGMVQGSCAYDPPELKLKSWIEIARHNSKGNAQEFDAEVESLIAQALAGKFDE